MDEKIKNELEREEMTDFHKKILSDSKELVTMSRSKMSEYYDEWDKADQIYRGIIQPDEEDNKAKERKEPQKMVVPVAYSQIQTFVSFAYALLMQRERFFELLGFSEDEQKPAKIGEALLSRDLQKNGFEGLLYQYLLDIARFGLGVFKVCWSRETQWLEQVEQNPMFSMFGINFMNREKKSMQQVTKYLGNKIINISPFRFFPDVRLPLTRHQEGEFVASEDEYSFISLRRMEKDGVIAGTKWVKPMTKESTMQRRLSSSLTSVNQDFGFRSLGQGQSKGIYVLTEVQRSIIPAEYKIEGEPMGPEDYPVKYNIQYINDERVVKCEPLNYVHDEFTYCLAQYTPDMHRLVNDGLESSIDQLQSVISWFINSRVASVRKVIDNKLLVDPSGVNMTDITERQPVIRLKPEVARQGVEKFIKQLEIQDVTTNHIKDAEFLKNMVQETTGVSDNALGQFHTGRRSATEAKTVNASSSNRLRLVTMLCYFSGLAPMGRQMLSNLRDGLDDETFVKLLGEEDAMEGASFIQVTKEDLAGNYDFELFDGTLPSEKVYLAQALEEILKAFMTNPEAAVALQMDPRAMLLEAMELRGIRNPKRFTLQRVPQVPNQNGQPAQSNILGPNFQRPGQPFTNPAQQPGVPAPGEQPAGGGVGASQPGAPSGPY